MAFVASVHPAEERGGAASVATIGIALGVVAGPSLSGGLYHWLGRHGPFGFVLAMLLLAAVAQAFLHFKEKSLCMLNSLCDVVNVTRNITKFYVGCSCSDNK